MNAAIARLNERHATFRQVKGNDREEMEQLARVSSREEIPAFAGFDTEENEEIESVWNESDTSDYATGFIGARWSLTSELSENLEE